MSDNQNFQKQQDRLITDKMCQKQRQTEKGGVTQVMTKQLLNS